MPIRSATMADSSAIVALLAELAAPATLAEVEDRLRLIDDHNPVFVAEDDGEVVGLCAVHVGLQFHRVKPVARVTAIVVTEAQRRKDWGRRLLDHAVTLAQERGCGMIELTSRVEREASHRFYDDAGFARTSIRYSKNL